MPKLSAEELLKIGKILEANKAKNFVQRVISPDDYPRLDLGNGQFATHKMSYATTDGGKAIVYPEVIYDEPTKALRPLGGRDAIQHAIKTGEYIEMPTEADADWFTKNYKAIWDQQ